MGNVISSIHYYYPRRADTNIPHIEGNPILGVLLALAKDHPSVFKEAHEKSKNTKLCHLNITWTERAVYLNDVEVIQQFSSNKNQKKNDKGKSYLILEYALGHNLLTTPTRGKNARNYEKWRQNRQFHEVGFLQSAAVALNAEKINLIVARFLREQDPTDIRRWATHLSLALIAQTKLGLPDNFLSAEEMDFFAKKVSALFAIATNPINVIWFLFPTLLRKVFVLFIMTLKLTNLVWFLFPAVQKFISEAYTTITEIDKIKDELHTFFVANIVKKHRNTIMQPNNHNFLADVALHYAHIDAEAGLPFKENLLDSRVISDAFAFLIAGPETTAKVLPFALLLLATHPEKQTILANEINEYCTDKGKQVTELDSFDIEQLPYLRYVLHETLRLYPPVPFLTREVVEKVSLNIKGTEIFIEPGTTVFISPFLQQRDARNFAYPLDFCPERFAPKPTDNKPSPYYESRFANDNRKAFMPFAVGDRDCPGKNLALNGLSLAIAQIISQFTVKITAENIKHPFKLHMHGTLELADEIKISLTPRVAMTESVENESEVISASAKTQFGNPF
jgi:cytochrome P450